MSKTTGGAIRANSFMFFPEFTVVLLKAVREGYTVQDFVLDQPERKLHMVFEVRIKQLDGERVPRISKRQAEQFRKEGS